VILEAAESLGPSLSSSALAALFSFDACKVFLAGILPRILLRLLYPDSLATVRYHIYLHRFVALSSVGLLSRILSCISLPTSSNLFQMSFCSLLVVTYRCLCCNATATGTMAMIVAAAAAAAAAAGCGASRNFETLTKSRAT